eukprot:jgi/Astpho2/1730/e_gw1.00032.131.1_t
MPLKSFYKFALPDLGMPMPPAARFLSLPPHQTLTLGMDTPEMWLVESVQSSYDLDNLRLEQLGSEPGLHAKFELEALMLTGQCVDPWTRRRDQYHPRGLQLYLGTAQQPHQLDTLVMSNLGYFQLKAGPGVWDLQLAPGGRSSEAHSLLQETLHANHLAIRHPGLGGVTNTSTPVVMSSMQGAEVTLVVTKNAGLEMADILDAEGSADGGSAAAWLKHLTGPEDDPETIHIFTVASGHMYERLQKIMILSVMKNTRHRVKFWFIKNYMSPQMKSFVPHMAAAYGFEYQFVTYKWPSWLHKQTEKQRIIWAYKILFLDVLFPLGLKKVIFCDSDQVIRGDMAELWDMDLQGAPFGFTPFCDNNKDMEGFRFWKQGFWKEHLRGKPYHISALFVVDLGRFRQGHGASGDQLRIVYDQLSKDPHSLSNLDQDLPNYAQHQVPIFSLPMEWLWCETWCGNSTKHHAKTIDLCNNPLTKEPKLEGARRIVKEWPGYDDEVRAFTAKVGGRLLV